MCVGRVIGVAACILIVAGCSVANLDDAARESVEVNVIIHDDDPLFIDLSGRGFTSLIKSKTMVAKEIIRLLKYLQASDLIPQVTTLIPHIISTRGFKRYHMRKFFEALNLNPYKSYSADELLSAIRNAIRSRYKFVTNGIESLQTGVIEDEIIDKSIVQQEIIENDESENQLLENEANFSEGGEESEVIQEQSLYTDTVNQGIGIGTNTLYPYVANINSDEIFDDASQTQVVEKHIEQSIESSGGLNNAVNGFTANIPNLAGENVQSQVIETVQSEVQPDVITTELIGTQPLITQPSAGTIESSGVSFESVEESNINPSVVYTEPLQNPNYYDYVQMLQQANLLQELRANNENYIFKITQLEETIQNLLAKVSSLEHEIDVSLENSNRESVVNVPMPIPVPVETPMLVPIAVNNELNGYVSGPSSTVQGYGTEISQTVHKDLGGAGAMTVSGGWSNQLLNLLSGGRLGGCCCCMSCTPCSPIF